MLPLDPATYRLDLPILFSQKKTPKGARLVSEEIRRLAAEVDHLMAADTAFLQLVSSVEWTERGVLLVRWTEHRRDHRVGPFLYEGSGTDGRCFG